MQEKHRHVCLSWDNLCLCEALSNVLWMFFCCCRLVIDNGESFGETRDCSSLFDDTVVILSQDQLRQVRHITLQLVLSVSKSMYAVYACDTFCIPPYYHLPRLRTKFGERAFSYSGPAAWNKLPQDIRTSSTLNCFKWKLKTYCFTEAFSC